MINVYAWDDKIAFEVPLSYYEELIIKAQRYDDIVAAAISGADLGWGDSIRLDHDAVEEYIKVVEIDKVATTESRLKAKREMRIAQAQEAAE